MRIRRGVSLTAFRIRLNNPEDGGADVEGAQPPSLLYDASTGADVTDDEAAEKER